MEKYFVGYHSLQLVTRGRVYLRYDEEVYTLGPGSFWFHYPEPFIQLRASGEASWHHRHVAFAGGLCRRWQREGLLAGDPLSCPEDRREEFAARFDQILGWLERGGPAPLAKARLNLELLLWELWEIRRSPVENRSLTDAVAQFVRERRFQAGSYQDLAEQMGMSLSGLRRRIAETAGVPLHQYARMLRLREARRLLRDTGLSPAEIADKLGFSDVYHFNKEFSRMAGIPPGAYRKSIL